jgi:flagellin
MTPARALGDAAARQASAVQRVSSGQRINAAADDAAGLAIATRLTAQLRGAAVAVRNVHDGIGLLQVAEGAAGRVTEQLQRIRELAVQAASAPLREADRSALEAEVQQRFQHAVAVQDATRFNGRALFDGQFTAESIQMGADTGQRVEVALAPLILPTTVTTAAYTVPAVTQQVTTTVSTPTARVFYASSAVTQALQAGDLTVNGVAVPASAGSAVPGDSADSAAAVKRAIQAAGVSGVSVSTSGPARSSVYTAADPGFSLTAGAMTLNGVSLPAVSGATMGAALTDLVAKVNAVSAASGITAGLATLSGATYVVISHPGGGNLDLQETVPGAASQALIGPTGLQRGSVYLQTPATVAPTPTVTLGGNNPGAAGMAAGVRTANIPGTPVTTSSTTTVVVTPAVDVPASTTTAWPDPHVSNPAQARATIDLCDALIDHIGGVRGGIGATLGRFDAILDSLAGTGLTLSAARSRITDADMAQETARLTASGIAAQAGHAMVAQATRLSGQAVLALLEGAGR